MSRRRTAILVSGRGSNMAALIEAARRPDYPAEIALVLSNRPEAGALAVAAAAGLSTAVVDHKAFADRASFEAAMQAELVAHGVEFVCLAGFMRLLTPSFIAAWDGRLLNIHPSLLPSFRGLNTHERALQEGVKVHGCTVHFVTPDLDAGPIVAQGAVGVMEDDTPDTLAARVLEVEHRLYPYALDLVVTGRARLVDGRVRVRGTIAQPVLVSPVIG